MSEKYVAPNTGQNHKLVYHTDKDCQAARKLRPASQHEIEFHGLDLCKYCDPDANPTQNEQDRSHYKSLKEAANE